MINILIRVHGIHVFSDKQMVIQHAGDVTTLGGTDPMDGTFHLAVCGIVIACHKICRGMDQADGSVLVVLYFTAFDDIRTHQTDFPIGFQTEEFRWGILCKVGCININFTGERYIARACRWIGRIVGEAGNTPLALRDSCQSQL